MKRRKFQGVRNILSFNRHFYGIGLGLLALTFISRMVINWSPVGFWFVIGGIFYGLAIPLIVSAFVYDISGFYRFDWMKRMQLTGTSTKQILNINAGFDETSFLIKDRFPESQLRVYDFYDAERHTEPAIVRARKVSTVYPNTQRITTHRIPESEASIDYIFLLSAVHEIRNKEERVRFLKECKRVCKPEGSMIIVEHLRDWPNFLAFTVGFTHFFSKKSWKNAIKSGGFTEIEETKFTPFMSIFKCNP